MRNLPPPIKKAILRDRSWWERNSKFTLLASTIAGFGILFSRQIYELATDSFYVSPLPKSIHIQRIHEKDRVLDKLHKILGHSDELIADVREKKRKVVENLEKRRALAQQVEELKKEIKTQESK